MKEIFTDNTNIIDKKRQSVVYATIQLRLSDIEKRINQELTDLTGVDIGPNHEHGGVSNGAIGFDAFFPKRESGKYMQPIKTIKF